MKPGDITNVTFHERFDEQAHALEVLTRVDRIRVETDDERFEREAREEVEEMTRGWDWRVQ